MEYKVFTPPLQLKDLVQCFWTLESTHDEVTPKDYFLMADSCPEIIFQYNEGFRTYSAQSARIRFQHSIHDRFTVGKKVGFFGVRLYPHAVSQLLRMPASEVVNDVFDFSDLFREQGTDLADQVYSSVNTLERITRVSDFLSKRAAVNQVDTIKYFVDQVIKSTGQVDISSMQRESGLSVKQFERRFKAVAGFPPKYFARIARFQGIKDRYSSSQFQSMTSLAYSCNYYDQSHFNREFKEFSGVQPLQYFKLPGQENTELLKPGKNSSNAIEQRQFNGYLPCGWFV
ncbi:helix-turn-helix domain-containing protein [Mucilaginibacter sp. OK098]|uniref:helix-turn-helix domain-containing protein n=1 Tax=Mucilaginibacter sp. OK098 TaxID=1855297 RepID=UPI0009227BCC|nr:helix-turn-helix domain-containing protein [Mucilaginibacter sp. OK098]SHL87752.1 Helix-turn-helix domain-containing protein [Mucilaginibacter sp. OK098]